MKKLALLLALLVSVAFAADSALVLSTSQKSGGVTTTVTVHRIQSVSDGPLTAIFAICREVTALSDGTVLADKFPAGDWLNVPLSPATVAAIQADIAKAKAASDADAAKVVAPKE